MAYEQEPNKRFIPYRAGDFRTNRPIQRGGQLTTPWQKGVQDLAMNQLTLWAQTAPPVIQDSKRVPLVLPVQNTYYVFAFYRFDVPGDLNPGASLGRRYLTVKIRGIATGSDAWQFQATTPSGTVASSSSGTGGAEVTLSVDVPIPEGTLGSYVRLAIRCTTTNNKTVTLNEVSARVKTVTSTGLGSGTEIYSPTSMRPVDSTVQVTETYPLHVRMMQDLTQANDTLWKRNVRHILNTCIWEVYCPDPTMPGTVATTITAGSNGVNVSTFAGAGVLNVVSTTGFTPTGSVQVSTGSGFKTVTYTGTTGTTFTGCTCASAGVMSTGGAVRKAMTSIAFSFDIDSNNKVTGHQWVYFPRQGVTNLRLYLDGYVQEWDSSSDTATLNIGFEFQPPQSFTIGKNTFLSATSGWPADGVLIPVPNKEGPLYLNLKRIDSRTKTLKITSMALAEEIR